MKKKILLIVSFLLTTFILLSLNISTTFAWTTSDKIPDIVKNSHATLTIVTHWYLASADDWVKEMWEAIKDRIGENNKVSIYEFKVSEDNYTTFKYIAWASVEDATSLIILLDWSNLAWITPSIGTLNNFFSLKDHLKYDIKVRDAILKNINSDLKKYSVTVPFKDVEGFVALEAVKLIIQQHQFKPFLSLPIHLIGHSRWGSVVSHMSEELGKHWILVDQVTMLDPHPMSNAWKLVSEAPPIFNNVIYSDTYFQNSDKKDWKNSFIVGYANSGTSDVTELTDLLINSRLEFFWPHSAVHSYYYWTITDKKIAEVDDNWYKEPRTGLWYAKSKIWIENGMKKRLESGIHPDLLPEYSQTSYFGYDKEKEYLKKRNLIVGELNWITYPNIMLASNKWDKDYDILSKTENSFNFPIFYKLSDYKDNTIKVFLDNDRDPFNNNVNPFNILEEKVPIKSNLQTIYNKNISIPKKSFDGYTWTYYLWISITNTEWKTRYDYSYKPVSNLSTVQKPIVSKVGTWTMVTKAPIEKIKVVVKPKSTVVAKPKIEDKTNSVDAVTLAKITKAADNLIAKLKGNEKLLISLKDKISKIDSKNNKVVELLITYITLKVDLELKNIADKSDDLDNILNLVQNAENTDIPTTETENGVIIDDDNSHIAKEGEATFSVVTGYPSSINSNDKINYWWTMNATVLDNSDDRVSTWVEYGKNGTFERSTTKRDTTKSDRNYTDSVSYFDVNTTYSFRAVAQKWNIITYGEVHTFTIGKPSEQVWTIKNQSSYSIVYDKFSVVTGYPSSINSNDKINYWWTMNATVLDNSDDRVSTWVEYGKNGTFERSTTKRDTTKSDRNYTDSVSYFDVNTTYSFRAVAQKWNIITYGEVHTFTIGKPSEQVWTIKNQSSYSIVYDKFSVVTGYPSSINSNDKINYWWTMNATVLDNSDDRVSTWVEYGKNGTFERSTTKRDTTKSDRNYTDSVSYFDANTTYSYRAVAQKWGDIVYGEVHTFTIDKK